MDKQQVPLIGGVQVSDAVVSVVKAQDTLAVTVFQDGIKTTVLVAASDAASLRNWVRSPDSDWIAEGTKGGSLVAERDELGLMFCAYAVDSTAAVPVSPTSMVKIAGLLDGSGLEPLR